MERLRPSRPARQAQPHDPAATRSAASQAYAQSGITASDLDLVEVHDCFTVAELLATEDLGLTERGQGGVFARDGEGRRNEGRTTVNGSGG